MLKILSKFFGSPYSNEDTEQHTRNAERAVHSDLLDNNNANNNSINVGEIQPLQNEMDIKYRDELGFDPFHLRDTKRNPEPLPSFRDMLQQYSLNDFDHSELCYEEENANVVPKGVIVNWLGSPFDPTLGENLRNWRTLAKDHPIVLFTDQTCKSTFASDVENNPALKAMMDFANKCKIHVVSVQDVFAGRMAVNFKGKEINIEKEFKNSLLQKSYGEATDLLRAVQIFTWGRTYADSTDVPCPKNIDQLRYTKNGIRVHAVARRNTATAKTINNDLFMAVPKHPKLWEVLSEQKKRYTSPNLSKAKALAQIPEGNEYYFSHLPPDYSYNKYYYLLDGQLFKRQLTMHRTGPGIFVDVFDPRQTELIEEKDLTAASKSHVTWLKSYPPIHQPTKDEEIKRILTNILFDLKTEPRMLMLSKYSETLVELDIVKPVLLLLMYNYPDQLKAVTHIDLGRFKGKKNDLDRDLPLYQFLTVIFNNKNKFPSLSKEGICENGDDYRSFDVEDLAQIESNWGYSQSLLSDKEMREIKEPIAHFGICYMRQFYKDIVKAKEKGSPKLIIESYLKIAHAFGYNINQIDQFNMPLLHFVCSKKDFPHIDEIIQLLIDAGADINAQYGENNLTPLEFARDANNVNAQKILEELGAKMTNRGPALNCG